MEPGNGKTVPVFFPAWGLLFIRITAVSTGNRRDADVFVMKDFRNERIPAQHRRGRWPPPSVEGAGSGPEAQGVFDPS
jgi:hypothetical protein